MPFLQKYNQYWTGGFFNYTYSPKYPEKMTEFDRSPLLLWIHFNNNVPGPGSGGGGLMSGINVHWLTIDQRRNLINFLKLRYRDNTAVKWQGDMGKPIHLTYEILKFFNSSWIIGWRRYFPARVRNIKMIAINWTDEELEEVINTDTARIIGVSPEFIQKQYILNTQLKLWGERQRIKKLDQKKIVKAWTNY